MINSLFKGKKSLLVMLVSAATAPAALASGYHFGSQSVSSQSTANASSAEAADASTIFYNPAGISKLSGTNISLNANLVLPDVKYRNAKAWYFDGQEIQGEKSGSMAKKAVFVPHLYASHELNDKWSVGLGLYVPFASGTNYQRDSVLRYNVNRMALKAIDINPVLSYKIDENNSVSVGLIGQYANAELRQFANLGRLAGLPNGVDGYAKVEGNDWGFGYTLGYLWDVNDKVRLGASYRSKVDHTLKGTAQWNLVNPAYASPALTGAVRQMGYKQSEGASVKITTPESISVHGMWKINDKWKAFGDVTWTRHSRFNTLNVNYENAKAVGNVARKAPSASHPHVPGSGGKLIAGYKKTTLKPNWRDTYKVGIGAAYQYSKPLELRFGIAYDQSPVRNANYRLSTLPDNDRIWLSVGAKYDFDENSSINLAYSYIHIKDAKANVNGWCGGTSPQTAKNCVSSQTNGTADYKSYANMLSVQYNYRF